MMVKPILDEKTVSKIEISSGSGKKEMEKIIDLNNLPKEIGGNCDMDIRQDPGPWNQELQQSYSRKSLFHSDANLALTYYPNL